MPSSPRVALVIADFNLEVTSTMKSAALAEIESAGASAESVKHVPGCYELPLVVLQQIQSDVDAVVALGFIERGETLHGQVMGQVVHEALMRLSLEYEKPIGLGIIGPGATPEQAHARKDAYARAAVRAALASLKATE
jgi:6,7-dimethyl-8-ribityllumazine synthase